MLPKPAYGSHLPVLLRLADVTDGPILELGMGLWSTPLLDLVCQREKRLLVSYDTDEKWFQENKQWESDYHKVHLVDKNKWDDVPILNEYWSIALVDHRPALRRRLEALRLRYTALFVVIHDSEPEIDRFYRYSNIYKHFRYRFDYTKVRPFTTVLSNFIDPTQYFSR